MFCACFIVYNSFLITSEHLYFKFVENYSFWLIRLILIQIISDYIVIMKVWNLDSWKNMKAGSSQ